MPIIIIVRHFVVCAIGTRRINRHVFWGNIEGTGSGMQCRPVDPVALLRTNGDTDFEPRLTNWLEEA